RGYEAADQQQGTSWGVVRHFILLQFDMITRPVSSGRHTFVAGLPPDSLPSELLRYEFVRVVGLAVLSALLSLWQLHFLPRRLLVRNLCEQVRDDIDARAPLVI